MSTLRPGDFAHAHLFADDVPTIDSDATSGVSRDTAGGGADVVSPGISTTF